MKGQFFLVTTRRDQKNRSAAKPGMARPAPKKTTYITPELHLIYPLHLC